MLSDYSMFRVASLHLVWMTVDMHMPMITVFCGYYYAECFNDLSPGHTRHIKKYLGHLLRHRRSANTQKGE